MALFLLACSSMLAVFLSLGWFREFRLRRALQTLLARLFRKEPTDYELDVSRSSRVVRHPATAAQRMP